MDIIAQLVSGQEPRSESEKEAYFGVLKTVLSTTEPIGAFTNSLRLFLRKKRELLRFLTTISANFGLTRTNACSVHKFEE